MNIVDTIRVQFSKQGRAKYISHLDLVRTMTRVLRRAAIPLWYTEGFSKHPYITFASPLSLGYEGECEYMDFRLEQEMAMSEIVERLNHSMPEGITVLCAAPAQYKVGEIAQSEWEIRFPIQDRKKLESVLSQDVIEVQKRTKKKTFKTVDIKPHICNVQFEECGEAGILRVILPTGEQSLNPSLLINAVYGNESAPVFVKRVALYMKNGKKFE